MRPKLLVKAGSAGIGPEETAKLCYNLWLGGVDAVEAAEGTKPSEEIGRLMKKAREETGEEKEFLVSRPRGKVPSAGTVQELFVLAGPGKTKNKTKKGNPAGFVDITEIIQKNRGSEITAAKACRLAVSAAVSGIPLEAYAGMHRNLAIVLAGERKCNSEY